MANERRPGPSTATRKKAEPRIDLAPLRSERRDETPRPHVRRWLETFLLE